MKLMSSLWMLVVFLASAFTFSTATLSAQDRRATSPESIRTREGFRVQLIRSAQADESSWISMTFDPAGRAIVGLDDFGLARLTIDEQSGQTSFERLPGTESLRHVRGVLYAHDSLYISATDSQGIYRMKDLGNSFEAPQLLQELSYNSRFGHGTNQMTLGPDQQIYFVIGNDVVLPPAMTKDSPYRNPQNDWLLPSRHDLGHDNRVGYIAKVDPTGNSWEVVAGGFRNQVDVAFNQDGEMFTWDADMEWDVGLPWYRPTRLNHVVSGGEYGWRWGTGKWPAWFPDSLPSTLDTGLGSPTGMTFGYGSDWPEPYRQALYMADWQFGRILIVDVKPYGSTYSASAEWFLEGGPLNVCDLTFGPNGALYFITGGRGSQSGLYRVTWTGPSPTDSPTPSTSREATEANQAARDLRHRLETYHRQMDLSAVDFIWSQLAHEDPWIRNAARIALENQPLESWRNRIVTAEESVGLQTALLAMARVGETQDQRLVMDRLLQSAWSKSQPEQWLHPLRTLQLSIIRHGLPDVTVQQRLVERLEPLFPQEHFPTNWLLQELLVKLRSPHVLSKSLALLHSATTQEEQVQCAKTLTHVKEGWDRESALQVVVWLERTRDMTGGHLVKTAWQNLRSDFTSIWDDSIRGALVEQLTALEQPRPAEFLPAQSPRPFVRKWTIDDLLVDVNALRPSERSADAGHKALAAANCLQCHRFGQRGTPIGPDLTDVSKRFDGRALLESMIDPSRQVDPKYANSSFLLTDGRVVTGRTIGVSQTQLTIEIDPVNGKTLIIERQEIEQSLEATRSPMPDGLLDTLSRDEVLDLIGLLRR
ncbi:MAG: c-type cytochrome [Pirellulaceae bacterium]|nr:c-type cytochrome [Pirellulaceae bacterium]